MATRRCNSCDGTYETVLADGTRYFHACPPIHRARVRRGLVEQVVDLADVLPTDDRLAEVFVARLNHRDENVQVVGTDTSGSAVTAPKADGAGAAEV